MPGRSLRRLLPSLPWAALALVVAPSFAWASGAGSMPWDAPIETIKGNISGPLVTSLAIVGLVVCGLTWGLTDNSSGVRKLVPLVFGVSLAAGAVGLASTFGWTGALL